MLWSSHLTEKSLFKSDKVLSYLKILVLQDLIKEKNYNKIIFRGGNKSIVEAVRNIASLNNIKFSHEKIKLSKRITTFRKIWYIVPEGFKGLIFLIRYFYKNYSLQNQRNTVWQTGKNTFFFFSYLTHFKNSKDYTSTQWGPLPGLLENKYKAKMNWLYLFIPSLRTPSKLIADKIVSRINDESDSNQRHVILQDYLSFRLLFKILKNWIRIQIRYSKANGIFDSFFQKMRISGSGLSSKMNGMIQ